MMTGLTEEIRQYVIDRSEAYKRDSLKRPETEKTIT